MSLSITNLTDGSTPEVVNGVVDIVFQAGGAAANSGDSAGSARAFFIVSDVAIDYVYTDDDSDVIPVTPDITAQAIGDCGPEATAQVINDGSIPPVTFHGAAMLSLAVPTTPGTYYLSFSMTDNKGVQFLAFRVRVLPTYNLPLYSAPSWLPPGLADLQMELADKTVNSAILSQMLGLAQGDDLQLAVIPSLAGTLIATEVTEITLSILPSIGADYEPLVFTASGTPLAPVNVGEGENYYLLTGSLSGQDLASWFEDADDAATTGAPASLPCVAQLSITYNGITTLSEQFPLPILQQV